MRKIFIIIIVIIGILFAIIGYNYSIAKTEKIALQDTLAQIEEQDEGIIADEKYEEQQNVFIVEENIKEETEEIKDEVPIEETKTENEIKEEITKEPTIVETPKKKETKKQTVVTENTKAVSKTEEITKEEIQDNKEQVTEIVEPVVETKIEEKQEIVSTPVVEQKTGRFCVDGGSEHIKGDGPNDHGYYKTATEVEQACDEYLSKLNTSFNYRIDRCECGLYYFWVKV